MSTFLFGQLLKQILFFFLAQSNQMLLTFTRPKFNSIQACSSPTWHGSPSLICKNQYFCHCGITMSCTTLKFCALKFFLGKESENLVIIAKFFVWKKYACAASENDKLKKRNILHLSEAVGILHVLSTSADLSKINWALSISPLSGKYTH